MKASVSTAMVRGTTAAGRAGQAGRGTAVGTTAPTAIGQNTTTSTGATGTNTARSTACTATDPPGTTGGAMTGGAPLTSVFVVCVYTGLF